MALPAGRKGVLPSELTPEGKIKNSGSSYVLPTASADTLGGVKVGSGLSIADGVLSANGGGGMTLDYVDFLGSNHPITITPPLSETHLYLALPYDGNKEPVIIYYLKQNNLGGWGTTSAEVTISPSSNNTVIATTSSYTYGVFKIY